MQLLSLTGYKWRYIRTVDSAAGTVKNARDSRFQAVFPLRGKIINAEKHNEIEVLNNKEVRDLIIQVGCGVREDINLKKLRYDKIILLCDADA